MPSPWTAMIGAALETHDMRSPYDSLNDSASDSGAYLSALLEATNAHADRAAVRRMAGCHARAEAIIEGLPVLVAFVYPVLMPVERVGARRSPVLAAAERLRETALKVTHVRVFVNSPERRAPRENHQRPPAPDPSERMGRDATFEVCLAVPLSPLHRYWHDRRGLLRRRGRCSLRNNDGFLHLMSDDITLHDLFPFVHLHFYSGGWCVWAAAKKGQLVCLQNPSVFAQVTTSLAPYRLTTAACL